MSLYLHWIALLGKTKQFSLAVQPGPPVVGPALLQEETGVPGENLRCLARSNWTTQFSHVTKLTLVR